MTTISSIDARFAQVQVGEASRGVTASVQNLVSGKKADANVADLSVGTVLASRVNTLRVAVGNAGQGKSLLETAKGALNTILDLLQKQKSLAVKAADDSISNNERGFLNQEFQAIATQIDRIADTANFNGKKLLDGSISGVASLNSASGESTENFTLRAVGDYGLSDGGEIGSGALSTTKTTAFNVVATNSIGSSRAQATVTFAGTTAGGTGAVIEINNGGATTEITFSWADTTDVANTQAGLAADAFVVAARASTDATVRGLVFEHIGNGVITVTAAETGTATNAFTLQMINNGEGTGGNGVDGLVNATTLFGGLEFATADRSFGGITTKVLGTNRSVAFADQTFDEGLQGNFENFTASLVPGGVNNGAANSVIFTVDINDKTYTSQKVFLFGSGGYNSNGSIIKSGQNITFYDVNGEVDTNGELVGSGFTLTVGSADLTVSGTTLLTVQDDLNTIAANLETQLADVVITQDRNIGMAVTSTTDADVTAAAGTIFEGIHGYNVTDANPAPGTKGDIILRSNGWGDDGSHGSMGAFSFNRSTGLLTTTIGGVTYSANLTSTTDTTTTTGQGYYTGTAYNTSTGAFTMDGTIVLATADTTDGRELRMDVATNVIMASTIVNSDDDELIFEQAFNNLFGVSENESLNFQVGVEASDTIGISIGKATTSGIYVDDSDVQQVLDVGTRATAVTASDVLDNALNKIVSLIADVAAAITAFDASIQNNNASIQNADAARSRLLDTDYTQESTRFAEARVRVDAATAVLTQINQRVQNLLQLLQQ